METPSKLLVLCKGNPLAPGGFPHKGWEAWSFDVSFEVRQTVNSSPPGQNGRHFADDIFRCIFVNEKFCILIKISLKFVPTGLIDNNPALVSIVARRRIGDKPLSEPMLNLFTDAYVAQGGDKLGGRWVERYLNTSHYLDTFISGIISTGYTNGNSSFRSFVPGISIGTE